MKASMGSTLVVRGDQGSLRGSSARKPMGARRPAALVKDGPEEWVHRGHSVARLFSCGRTLTTSLPSRSEEHTSELQSLMRSSYAVFSLKKKTHKKSTHYKITQKQ